MQALLNAGALLAWAAASFAGAAVLASYLPRRWGFSAAPVLLAVLLAAPMVDEARAKPRFQALCEERAHIRIRADKLEGVALRVIGHSVTTHIDGPLVAKESVRVYHLAANDEPAYDYSELTAEPGWFVRSLWGPEVGTPMLFTGSCAPPDVNAFLQRHPATAPPARPASAPASAAVPA